MITITTINSIKVTPRRRARREFRAGIVIGRVSKPGILRREAGERAGPRRRMVSCFLAPIRWVVIC